MNEFVDENAESVEPPERAGKSLDGILRRVSGLLSRAEHPRTPEPEAKACREKAQALMQRYRIEEAQLVASGTASLAPVSRVVAVSLLSVDFSWRLEEIFSAILAHVDVRGAWSYGPDPDANGARSILVTCVGYESDIRFAIAMFSVVKLQFLARVSPSVNPEESDADNVYRLRSAGIERWRIAEMMGWPATGGAHARVTRLYQRACAERGEEATVTGREFSANRYRIAFAAGFSAKAKHRLRLMRISDGDGALVIAGRREAVDEAFYAMFPGLRPKPAPASEPTPTRKTRALKAKRLTRSELAGWDDGARAATSIDLSRRADDARPARRVEA